MMQAPRHPGRPRPPRRTLKSLAIHSRNVHAIAPVAAFPARCCKTPSASNRARSHCGKPAHNARKGTGKTRSLSKTIGCPMIDKDPQMIR